MNVTVLMTVYNGSAFLKEAIISVLKQTFKDFEFLIVNDASTDNSLEIIESFRDPRVKAHHNHVNIGQTRSLNVGLNLANGSYIARMDADDLVYPQWLEELVREAGKDPSVAVISPKVVLIDQHDRVIKELSTPLSWQEINLKSLFSSPINHVGSLMRRDMILDVGGYDPKMKIVADYDLWCRFLKNSNRLIVYDKVLVAVRVHQSSISVLEADKRVVTEMVEVIRYNAKERCGMNINVEQGCDLWCSAFDGAEVLLGEFEKGLLLLERMATGLGDRLQFEKKSVLVFIRQTRKIFILKRIVGFIRKNKMQSVRETAGYFARKEGIFCIFSFFWLISFFGPLLKAGLVLHGMQKARQAKKMVAIT